MKKQELLRAIRNADPKYYEEAQQRIHHRKEKITMQSTITKRIMSGTAAAAVFALAAIGGLKLYRAYAGQSEDGKIVITQQGSAADAPVTDAGKENLLGGHGALQISVEHRLIADSDNWYVLPQYVALKDTDPDMPDVLLKQNAKAAEILADGEFFLADGKNGGLYIFSEKTGAIFAVDETGARTRLNGADVKVPDGGRADILRIMKLTDTKYYIDGYLFTPESIVMSEFWQIFDTETGKSTGEEGCSISHDRLYSDGNAGVYTKMEVGEGDAATYALVHITEEKTEVVLNDYLRSSCWYLYDNCVYYRVPEGCGNETAPDFFKYDLTTGEKTTVIKDCGFEEIVFTGDRVYTQIGAEDDPSCAHMVSFKPDLSDRKDWTVQFPESVKGQYLASYLTDICGDSLLLEMVTAEPAVDPSDNDTAEYSPRFALCNLATGEVQFYRYEHNPYAYAESNDTDGAAHTPYSGTVTDTES